MDTKQITKFRMSLRNLKREILKDYNLIDETIKIDILFKLLKEFEKEVLEWAEDILIIMMCKFLIL